MTEPGADAAWADASDAARAQVRGSVWRMVVGLAAGAAVASVWWRTMGPVAEPRPEVSVGLATLAGILLMVALGIQVMRTAVLIQDVPWRALARPVIVGHGTNALFSTAGDLLEVVLLSRLTGRSVPDILVQLLYRASTTASVALAAVLVGAGPVGIALAALGLATVTLLGAFGTPTLTVAGRELPHIVPIGVGRAVTLVLVTVAQLVLVTGSVALAIVAVGGQPEAAVVARAAGSIDLLSYLPVPLANVGLHHVGMTWSPGSSPPNAWGAALHHVITLGVGVLALIGGWLWPVYGWGRKG